MLTWTCQSGGQVYGSLEAVYGSLEAVAALWGTSGFWSGGLVPSMGDWPLVWETGP